MTKPEIIQLIIHNLELDLAQAKFAAEEAMKGATHDQSKAETQYDTLGLEHAYLAEGQSRRMSELQEEIVRLENWQAPIFSEQQDIYLGALLQLIHHDGLDPLWVFLVPAGGGQKLTLTTIINTTADTTGQIILNTITPEAPLCHAILGKALDDEITLPNGQCYEVKQLC